MQHSISRPQSSSVAGVDVLFPSHIQSLLIHRCSSLTNYSNSFFESLFFVCFCMYELDAAPVLFGGNTMFGASGFQNTSKKFTQNEHTEKTASSALILWHLAGSASEPFAWENILRAWFFFPFSNVLAGGKMQGNKLEARKRGTRLKAPSEGCKEAHANTQRIHASPGHY